MPLPRYQQLGVEVGGGTRGIDFPSRGEMTAGYNALAQTLQGMSEAFFKEAQTAAGVEGEKYGAENAPTQEQLKQAIESGTPLPAIGDARTYFGRAAARSYSDVLTTQVQYAAKADISKIKSDAEGGVISVNAIVPKINSVIQGYKGALADADPGLARKLEAQLAYEGNNAFLAASKSIASKAAAELKTKNAIEGYDIINSLRDDFNAGDTISPDGTRLNIEDRINIRSEELRKISSKLPATMAKTLEEKFNKEIAVQQKNYVLDWVMGGADNEERIVRRRAMEDIFSKKQIDQTIDPSGSVTRVLKAMEPTEVRDSIKISADLLSLRQREDDRIIKSKDAATAEANSKTYEEFVYKIEAARRGQGPIPTLDELKQSGLPISGDQGINQASVLRMINSIEFGQVKTNREAFNDLYNRIILPDTDPNKLKDSTEIQQAIARGVINTSDAARLFDAQKNAKTPEGRNEENYKKTFLNAAKNELVRKDPMTGLSQGNEAYLAFEQDFHSEYNRRKALGEKPTDMLDPRNKNSLWGLVLENQKSPIDLLRSQTDKLRQQSSGKYSPPSQSPDKSPKKPDETTEEYIKRMGQ